LLTRLVVLAIHCLSCSALPSCSVSNARPLRYSIALTCLSLSCLCVCLLICLLVCVCRLRRPWIDILGSATSGSTTSAPTPSARTPSDRLPWIGAQNPSDRLPLIGPPWRGFTRIGSPQLGPLARLPLVSFPRLGLPRLVPPARPPSARSPGSTHSALPGQISHMACPRLGRFWCFRSRPPQFSAASAALFCAPPLVLDARGRSATASSTHISSCALPFRRFGPSCARPLALSYLHLPGGWPLGAQPS
jgi:hypothetical protein